MLAEQRFRADYSLVPDIVPHISRFVNAFFVPEMKKQ